MRPLVLDGPAKIRAYKLWRHALSHREYHRSMLYRSITQLSLSDIDQNFIVYFDTGYRIVLTVEQQRMGWVFHFSVWVEPTNSTRFTPYVNHMVQEMILTALSDGRLSLADSIHSKTTNNITEHWFLCREPLGLLEYSL